MKVSELEGTYPNQVASPIAGVLGPDEGNGRIPLMDAGSAALIAGLVAVGIIALIPPGVLKTLGGLLIGITLIAIFIDGLLLIFR